MKLLGMLAMICVGASAQGTKMTHVDCGDFGRIEPPTKLYVDQMIKAAENSKSACKSIYVDEIRLIAEGLPKTVEDYKLPNRQQLYDVSLAAAVWLVKNGRPEDKAAMAAMRTKFLGPKYCCTTLSESAYDALKPPE